MTIIGEIKRRADGVTARPAADGRFYSDGAQAIYDREVLLATITEIVVACESASHPAQQDPLAGSVLRIIERPVPR